MSWMDRVGGLLKQYSGGASASAQPAPDVNAHFDEVAKAAPPGTIGEGLAGVLHSGKAGSFADVVAHLFSQSDSYIKTELLNRLFGSSKPEFIKRILADAGLQEASALNQPKVAPQDTDKMPENAVREIAAHAQQQNPGIVEEVSHFYAQHPGIVKTLGGKALSELLGKVAEKKA